MSIRLKPSSGINKGKQKKRINQVGISYLLRSRTLSWMTFAFLRKHFSRQTKITYVPRVVGIIVCCALVQNTFHIK